MDFSLYNYSIYRVVHIFGRFRPFYCFLARFFYVAPAACAHWPTENSMERHVSPHALLPGTSSQRPDIPSFQLSKGLHIRYFLPCCGWMPRKCPMHSVLLALASYMECWPALVDLPMEFGWGSED